MRLCHENDLIRNFYCPSNRKEIWGNLWSTYKLMDLKQKYISENASKKPEGEIRFMKSKSCIFGEGVPLVKVGMNFN